jgi:hypothetical protein
LYILGYNAEEDGLLPADWDWSDPTRLDEALKTLTDALRPWTIDFHVAQNDATVKGSGNHDKTGHHCLPNDPNGKLSIAHHAGYWLRDENGEPNKAFEHICWDGCMFPNAVMSEAGTWNDILAAMISVRDAHGWAEPTLEVEEPVVQAQVEIVAELAPETTPEPARTEPRKPRAKSKTKKRAVSKPAAKSKPTRPVTRKVSKPSKSKRMKMKTRRVKVKKAKRAVKTSKRLSKAPKRTSRAAKPTRTKRAPAKKKATARKRRR